VVNLHLKYFGVLKNLMGSDGVSLEGEVLELPTGFSVGELIELLRERGSQSGSGWDGVWDSVGVVVNERSARLDEELFDGDEVVLLSR
jgi:molybdopterin converting factor small subunit